MDSLDAAYVRDMTHMLRSLRRGEKLVYASGVDLYERKAARIATVAMELYKAGAVTLVQKRLGPPMKFGKINWHNGVGPGFAYIAIGLRDDPDARDARKLWK
jgi:hypothetical protein